MNDLPSDRALSLLSTIVATPVFNSVHDLLEQAGLDFKYNLLSIGICSSCSAVDIRCSVEAEQEECPNCQAPTFYSAHTLGMMLK